jgi:hypothetical protein
MSNRIREDERTESQIFRYKGPSLEIGSQVIDEAVKKWYEEHPNCKVKNLTDKRGLNVTKDLDCECSIEVVLKYKINNE